MVDQVARFSHEAAAVGSRTWLWGGANHSHCFPRSDITTYDPALEMWTQHVAQSAPSHHIPPPSLGSSCTALGSTVYSYGGQTPGIGYNNDLYAFDTNTVTWRNVHVRGQKPPPVRHCGLCSTNGKIYIFGGYGPPLRQEHIQEGGNWVEIGDGKGVNNVFYEYNLNTEEWSCVDDCDSRPEPRNGHTLTAVEHKIILIGGRGCNGSKLSDIHVYDIRTQKWNGIAPSDVWPQPRCFHTACLTHSDHCNCVVLMLGGIGNDSKPCSDDAYLFDVELLKWYQIADHGLPLDRYHHTSCCQLIQSGADTVVHVTVFGGSFCPSQSLQPVSAFISFVLGPHNHAYMACELKRLQDKVAYLREIAASQDRLGASTTTDRMITHQCLERNPQIEYNELSAEQTVALSKECTEARAKLEQQIQENRRLGEEVEQMRQQALELREQSCTEIQRAREQSQRITDRARREVQRTRQENEQLQHRANMAEAALHETQQHLKVYRGIPDVTADELVIDQMELGTGSFGVVHTGHWRGVRVAVKTSHSVIMSPQLEEQCRRELAVYSQLHHPHIVQICGAVMINGSPLKLVMELMQGSLCNLIKAAAFSRHCLSYHEQIDLAEGTTAGIDYLHQLRPYPLVHGNIRSSNVMVTRDMVAKIGDLETSFFSSSPSSESPSSNYQEERLSQSEISLTRAKSSSDIFNLGIVLIELFTGISLTLKEINVQLEMIANDKIKDLCTRMTIVDVLKRPLALECLCFITRQRETDDYKMLPGRRLVKGHLDGQEMSLNDSIYV